MFNSSSNEDENGFPHAGFLTYKSVSEENHPRYYIKMFIKLVQNYTTYNKQLVRFFGSSDPELSTREVFRHKISSDINYIFLQKSLYLLQMTQD